MQTIGERLKSERERLGFSQSDMSALTGVSRKTQFNYENGERYPDATYLAALHEKGGDVLFILSGLKQMSADGSESTAEPDFDLLTKTIEGLELLLKSMRRELPAEKKARIIVMLYRSFLAQHQVAPAMIREMIELAA